MEDDGIDWDVVRRKAFLMGNKTKSKKQGVMLHRAVNTAERVKGIQILIRTYLSVLQPILSDIRVSHHDTATLEDKLVFVQHYMMPAEKKVYERFHMDQSPYFAQIHMLADRATSITPSLDLSSQLKTLLLLSDEEESTTHAIVSVADNALRYEQELIQNMRTQLMMSSPPSDDDPERTSRWKTCADEILQIGKFSHNERDRDAITALRDEMICTRCGGMTEAINEQTKGADEGQNTSRQCINPRCGMKVRTDNN